MKMLNTAAADRIAAIGLPKNNLCYDAEDDRKIAKVFITDASSTMLF